MKRALTGFAAAAVVLGTTVPMAFAATAADGTWYSVGSKQAITVNNVDISNPYELVAKDSGNNTAYFPIFYFNQALSKLGNYTASWDGVTHTWSIIAPSVDATKISVEGGVGTGNTSIAINGVVVKKINTFAAKDPAAAKNSAPTTYFPAYYINNVFAALGAKVTWSGQTGLSITAAPQTVSGESFSTFAASGNQTGNGTATSPAVSSNGGAITLKTQLTDSNGNPVANTSVSLTVSGAADATPVVSSNGSYLSLTANTAKTSWTGNVTTDTSGNIDLSIVGTGSYTVSLQAPQTNAGAAVKTSASLAFLGQYGLITAGNTSPDISTISNPTAGVTPVTFTLPLSGGNVQAGKEVTFKFTGGSDGKFTTASGLAISGTSVNVYSNSQGQATVYVNDFTATDAPKVEAFVTGTTPSSNTPYVTLSYKDPNATTTPTSLNNIGAFIFDSSVSGADKGSASSVTGVPSGNDAYFAPVGTDGNILSGSNAAETYTFSVNDGYYISGLEYQTGTGAYQSLSIPSVLSNPSQLTVTVTHNSGSYSIAVNGVPEVTATTDDNALTFGASVAAGSSASGETPTITMSSGSVSATAQYAFSHAASYVSSVNPVISNLSTYGSSENLTFTVLDANGNPVANQSATLADDSSLSGVWITAVNGTVLDTNEGTNGAEPTPIPLYSASSMGYTGVSIPGVVSWAGSTNPVTVFTNSQGQFTVTLQNGNVSYWSTAKSTAGSVYQDPKQSTSGSTNIATYVKNPNTVGGTVYLGSSTDAKANYSTNNSQVGQINW